MEIKDMEVQRERIGVSSGTPDPREQVAIAINNSAHRHEGISGGILLMKDGEL